MSGTSIIAKFSMSLNMTNDKIKMWYHKYKLFKKACHLSALYLSGLLSTDRMYSCHLKAKFQ